jgi:hypothetical protein
MRQKASEEHATFPNLEIHFGIVRDARGRARMAQGEKAI